MPATTTRKNRKPQQQRASNPVDRPAPLREPIKVLIALDGSRASNAALRFTRKMAQIGAWTPDAVTVTQPLPTYVGEYVLPSPPLSMQAIEHAVLLQLRTQLRRHGLPAWPATVRFGPTGWSIIETAHELGAQMIVLGLGKHGRVAQLFGAETANKVARRTDLPTLAVHASTRGLPRIAVVAMDFGESSIIAAKEALQLLQPGGELHLVHVAGTFNMTSMADAAWKVSYAEAVEKQFASLTHALEPMTARLVRTKLLAGDVVDSVATYAKSAGADLIAAGSHNQGVIERVLLGSTTAQLLRAAPCSVLIAPPSAAGA
jgi:nucleotide-binding universal stress UspA family protein